ncbi:HK97 gp10 family phage protein, partial [Nostoc sp. NIES-2111]
ALAAGARIVRDEARRSAPVLRQADARRKPGTVRDAINVRTSKQARADGNVGVFVNVRPLKASQVRAFKAKGGKGASNPADPFYWRWLEFGRQGRAGAAAAPRRLIRAGSARYLQGRRARRAVGPLPAIRFLQRAAGRLGEALKKFEELLGPAIARINNRLEP